MYLAGPLRHGFRTVAGAKRLLAAVALVDLVVCLPAAAFVARQVHAESAHRVAPLEIAKNFDADFMSDLRGQGANGSDDHVNALCIASFVLFFLLRPFVKGAYVGLAATHRRVHFGHFAREGGAVYWKFLRLALVAGVVAYLLSIAAKPLLEQVDEWAQLRTEPTANRYKLVTGAVVFAAYSVVAMMLDYARVGIRLQRRPGVLAELGRSALFVLQHPGRTLFVYAIAFAMEVGVVVAGGWFVQLADGGYLTSSVIVLVLVQLVVMLREAARLFHVAAAWHVRSAEAGDEGHAPTDITPEPDQPDVLRAPLPWNVR